MTIYAAVLPRTPRLRNTRAPLPMQALTALAPLVAFFATYRLRGLYAATAVLMAAMVLVLALDRGAVRAARRTEPGGGLQRQRARLGQLQDVRADAAHLLRHHPAAAVARTRAHRRRRRRRRARLNGGKRMSESVMVQMRTALE